MSVTTCLSACVFHHAISAHAYFTMFSCACVLHRVLLNMHFLPRFSGHAYISSVSTHAYFTQCLRACVIHIVFLGLYHVVLLMWTLPRGFAHVEFTTWFCSCRLYHVVLLMSTLPRGFAHVDFTTWHEQNHVVKSTWAKPLGKVDMSKTTW